MRRHREIARRQRLADLVDSDSFNAGIAAVIGVNALFIGAGTYPSVEANYGDLLDFADLVFLCIYVAELLLRMLSYRRLPDFFRNGWNVYDFLVISAVLIPALRADAALLRLLRLARVARLVRFLPEAQLLTRTIMRAVPPMFSTLAFLLLLLFLYGMVGWQLFGQALPEQWGTIGRSMVTLFILLTLENLPVYMGDAAAVTLWATPFFISYVILAGFLMLNLIVGVILDAMTQSRQARRDDLMRARGLESADAPRMLRQLADELEYLAEHRPDPPEGSPPRE